MTVPLHTRCFLRWQSVPCRNQLLPEHTEDGVLLLEALMSLPLSHPFSPHPDHSGRFFLCRLPFQCCFQHRWQLFATHGSSPQNTETRLRTQIILLGHSGLQNLRQGRFVFYAGARPTTVHQGLDTRHSIRLPNSSQHPAIPFSQAQAPGRTVL